MPQDRDSITNINNTQNQTEHQLENKLITILWFHSQSSDNFELNYAYGFCESYFRKSLDADGISFYWVNIADLDKSLSIIRASDFVLSVTDPLLIVNWKIIMRMQKALQKGYHQCGAMFNVSEFSRQIASPAFTVLNTTTFEELEELYSNQAQVDLKEVNELDSKCILYRTSSYFQFLENKNEEVFNSSSHSIVLLNSFVFTFESIFGTVRTDLVNNIPEWAKSVLDIGCFDGNMGKHLLSLRNDVTIDGIELCETSAELAAKDYHNVFNGYLEDFKPKYNYDTIICGDVLEHLQDPWLQLKRISEFLNPNGILILSIPNAGHWSLVNDQLNGKFEYLPWGLSCVTHIRWFTEESIKEALSLAGFEIERINYEQIEPSPNGEKFINKIVELKLGNKNSLLTNEFLIIAKKK